MIEEFLSREATISAILGEHSDAHYPEWYASILMRLPAADVAPVVHGNWLEEKKQALLPVEYDDTGEPILHDYVVYRCDRCGRTCNRKEPYCHCGAKMD